MDNLNPPNFEPYNINLLCLSINGLQIPLMPLQPDFEFKKFYVYHTLLWGTGIHFLNGGTKIPSGYCLSTFDLTPDLSSNYCSHWNLITHESVRIHV